MRVVRRQERPAIYSCLGQLLGRSSKTPIASLRPTLWFAPRPSSEERLGGPPQEHPKRGI